MKAAVPFRSGALFGRLAVLIGAAFSAGVPAAEAPKTAQQWLQAMALAMRDLDYDGVFSYYTANRAQQVAFDRETQRVDGAPPRERTFGFGVAYGSAARLATFRVVHKVADGIERERIVHLNGPPREILRHGEEVTCVLQPDDELLALEGTIPGRPYEHVLGRRFEDVSDNYRVVLRGRDRVAARPAMRLNVTPHDHDRFGYRLWLDEATGVLLRAELHDSEGTNLEIFQFTSLRLGEDVADADLEPATDGTVVRRLSQPASAKDNQPSSPGWSARWVPQGFRLTSADTRQTHGRATHVDTLVFSDGLAAFSVFVEAMPESGASNIVSRNGATVVLTHLAAGAAGDHLVTVVGEVPVATARRIAGGIYQR